MKQGKQTKKIHAGKIFLTRMGNENNLSTFWSFFSRLNGTGPEKVFPDITDDTGKKKPKGRQSRKD